MKEEGIEGEGGVSCNQTLNHSFWEFCIYVDPSNLSLDVPSTQSSALHADWALDVSHIIQFQ